MAWIIENEYVREIEEHLRWAGMTDFEYTLSEMLYKAIPVTVEDPMARPLKWIVAKQEEEEDVQTTNSN